MRTATGFHYNDEYSGNKNVIKIRTSGGLVTDSFLGSITNQVVKTKNSIKTYLQESELEPLVIPMALYFDQNLDEGSIRRIKKWLAQDDFKELIFEDDPEKVYFAKIDGDSNLSHNAVSSGYVEFNFLTNSAYSFSRIRDIEDESNTEFQTMLVHNEGDLTVLPKIKIVMKPTNETDVEIFNDTTGEHLLLKNNLVNETIIIWNEYEEFETSSNLRYCYDDHIGTFISLVEGVNELRFKGNFSYVIEYRNIYL